MANIRKIRSLLRSRGITSTKDMDAVIKHSLNKMKGLSNRSVVQRLVDNWNVITHLAQVRARSRP